MQRVKVEVTSSKMRLMPNAIQVVQNDMESIKVQLAVLNTDGEILTIGATYSREADPTIDDPHREIRDAK